MRRRLGDVALVLSLVILGLTARSFMTMATPPGEDHRFGPESPEVTLILEPETPRSGETVRAQIWISRASDLTDVPFQLAYDPTLLEYVMATEGPFLGSDATPTWFLVRDDASRGSVRFNLSRYDRSKGVQGGGLLATAEFRVKRSGAGDLVFSQPAVRDASGAFQSALFNGARFETE